MASGSQGVVDLDEGDVINETIATRTIPEMFSSLRSAFMDKHFSEVEEGLVFREKKLKLEIEELNEKYQIERLRRIKAENENLVLKEENLQSKKEQDEFNERLKNIAEDKRRSRELKEKIRDLECAKHDSDCAKLKAETEVELYKSKFEELETRVLLLEKDLVTLKNEESSSSKNGEVPAVGYENAKINVKVEVDVQHCNDNVVTEANGVPTCHSDVGDSASRGARFSGEVLGEKAVSQNEKAGDKVANLKVEIDVFDGNEALVLGINGECRSNLPENTTGDEHVSGGEGPQVREIIEIEDSSDDSHSGRVLSRKACQDVAGSSKAAVENETKPLKRKQVLCYSTICSAENDQVADNSLKGENKRPKCQDLMHGPSRISVNNPSASTLPSVSNRYQNSFSISRKDPAVLRPCEEKIGEGFDARNQNDVLLDGLGDSDSDDSSSSSDSDSYFAIDFSAISNQGRANANKQERRI